MAANENQEAFLKTYANEKEPEDKRAPAQEADQGDEAERQNDLVAEGIPLHSLPAGIASAPSPWSTGLFACLGSNDEFFSSDLEVCLLGSCTPCVLYASNVERLYPTTENMFTNHFLSYTGLFCLGNFMYGCNALAPCFSWANRRDMRKQYNLMGSGECFAKACGCGSCYAESGNNREGIEAAADFATHYLCHACALCQEGREIRRRTPHPGFIRSCMPMNAPTQQLMSA